MPRHPDSHRSTGLSSILAAFEKYSLPSQASARLKRPQSLSYPPLPEAQATYHLWDTASWTQHLRTGCSSSSENSAYRAVPQQAENSVPRHPATLQAPPPRVGSRDGRTCPADASELELSHLNPGALKLYLFIASY